MIDKVKVEVEGGERKATCHLDEERGQEQRLSPVSVMDFQSQDGDDDCNDSGGCDDGHSDDEGTSPTFERSLTSIRSKSLLSIWLHCEANSVVDSVTLASCKVELLRFVCICFFPFFLYDGMNLSRTT